MYLNRIYELQIYRTQIKNFLDTYKPYFIYDNEKYFIEDIASYHIHAADYYKKDAPNGGHSNYGGNKLDYFKPIVTKEDLLGVKDLILHNPRNNPRAKSSSIYPETWSEFMCDLKAIEVMMSENVIIEEEVAEILRFRGKTSDGLDIVV